MLQPLSLTCSWSRSSTLHPLPSLSPTRAQHRPMTAPSLDMAQASPAGKFTPVHTINILARAAVCNTLVRYCHVDCTGEARWFGPEEERGLFPWQLSPFHGASLAVGKH
jgi:hypothetical protein